MCPWALGPQMQTKGARGPFADLPPGAQTKSSVPPWRPPETQDAVGVPPLGPWSDTGVGWLGLCGFWGSGRAHVELGDSRVLPADRADSRSRPAGTATCSTWSTCSSTGRTWRPRMPRGTQPCTSALSTTRSVGACGWARSPNTLPGRVGAGAGTVPRALQGAGSLTEPHRRSQRLEAKVRVQAGSALRERSFPAADRPFCLSLHAAERPTAP